MGERLWYVVQTKPNEEVRASQHLARQSFGVYMPRYAKTRRHARKIESVVRPLFPRYLFIALDLARDRWRSIQSTFGVVGLIMSGDQPAPLPTEVVDAIREREDGNGHVMLGLAPGLGVGSRIRLLDGLFADHSGVLERIADERRVAVLVQLLGRQVRVLVDAESVAAA
jgi:transcriptional antiterminator RfaH